MKLIGRILSVIIVLGALAALCLPADAGAYLYPGKRKKVYCGIVALVRTDPITKKDTIINQDPIDTVTTSRQAVSGCSIRCLSLFAKLDVLTNMKPSGWTFENPLAGSQDKYCLDYWLVNVKSARNLSRLNVLYFPGSEDYDLTDEERENLRQFVDGGGVLWVDNTKPGSVWEFKKNASSSTFFISQLSFQLGGSGFDGPASRHHPLVSSPYWLTEADIMSLGIKTAGGGSYCDMGTTDPDSTAFDILFSIVDNGASPLRSSVVANTYGSGRVVATANAIGQGCMLNEPYSLPNLKLAFNIISYASSWTDIRKNPKHTGSSIDTLGANRLVQKWSLLTQPGTAPKEIAPLIYKNTIFYTSGNMLYALDANGDTHGGMWPDRSDPALVDIYNATGAVVIWTWSDPKGGTLSAPTIATIQKPDPKADCSPIEAILVMNNKGNVYVLDAFPILPDNTVMLPIVPLTADPFETAPGAGGETSKWPSPPIYVNGWIYALGGNGRLYAINPCKQKSKDPIVAEEGKWQCPDYLTNPVWEATPKCGPSFGYMKNVDNGAIVGMVYWFDSPPTNPAPPPGSTDINDHICGVPVSVSNDRRTMKIGTTRLHAEIQATFMGHLTAPDPRLGKEASAIRMLESDGETPINPLNVMLNYKMDPVTEAPIPVDGFIYITTGQPMPSGARIYASYTLSYGPTHQANMVGGEIEPKSASSNAPNAPTHEKTTIPGTPAMGPDNMMFLTGTREPKPQAPKAGGSILAYRNDGGISGTGKLRWHYFLHSGVGSSDAPGIELPGGALQGVVQCSIPLYDPQYPTPVPTQPMLDPQPSSSPAVVGGKVFVTVSGKVLVGPNHDETPAGALLCLKANQEFVIRITQNAGYDASGNPKKQPKNLWKLNGEGRYNVKLWQPDLFNPGGVPLMDAPSTGNGINVDYDTGTITFTDFTGTKLQKMMIATNTFSPSLPVWVYLDNIEVPIDWSTWKPRALDPTTGLPDRSLKPATSDSVDLSGWNNMLWYYVVKDHTCAGAHSPPTVIGTTVYFVCDDGYLYSLDTESGEAEAIETTKKLTCDPPPPVGHGGTEDAPVSVAGSNGVLMVPGMDGLYALANTPTLVADNNRLVEVDGGGEVTWSVDSISWPAAVPASNGLQMAMKQGPVNKPSRARYGNTGEILFANSGANQVCKIDKGGMIGFGGANKQYVRWIYEKFADPKHLLRSGQPTQLRGPTDAIMWQEMEPMPTIGPTGTPGTSVVHCLIADSGNSRILDLVYRMKNGQFVNYDGDPISSTDAQYIDADSGFIMPELNWASKTDSLNERYAFDCLQKVGVERDGKWCEDVWAASSNYAWVAGSNSASTGIDIGADSPKGGAGLGGAILAIGYREQKLGTTSTAAGDWDYSSSTSGTITARCDHINWDGTTVVPLANPRFFDVITDFIDGNATRSLLICDNYGVYKALINPDGPPTMTISLTQTQYRELRRLDDPSTPGNSAPELPLPFQLDNSGNLVGPPLIATCAQKLPSGRLLITNSYSGTDATGAISFGGEVFEYDPNGPIPVPWCSPIPKWVDPIAHIWKQESANTYDLKQPKSAFRQL